MKNQLFAKLIELREKESHLVGKIKEEELRAVPYKDSLSKTREELTRVEEAILENMESENVKTYTYDDRNVTAASRKTLGIVDEVKVMESLMNDKDLRKITKLKQSEIKDKLTIVKLNHTTAKEFAKQLVDIGNKVDGVEVRETKYLTVKEV